MYNKLNHRVIESYAEAFTHQVTEVFFSENETISGEQIMSITKIRQVNLFVIKSLLLRWRQETQKLKSPYFDYETKPVKKALKEFLNLLSQHISIQRKDFEPLLKKATYDSLLLIFSPYDYYCKEVNGGKSTRVSLKALKDASKYIKVNHHVIQSLTERFEREGLREVFNDEAFRLLNEIFEEMNMVPDETEAYESLFSEVVPLNLDAIYGNEESAAPREAKPPVDNTSNIVKEEIREIPNPVNSGHDVGNSINDSFSGEQKVTLNDRLNPSPKQNLADIHLHQKIPSIKKHVTLNQKFRFINELFGGDSQAFEKAVDFLDTCEEKGEALSYLTQTLPSWQHESKTKEEMIAVLSKKYD